MSLNRSQCGSCSTKYDTMTVTEVVYKRFGTRTPNNWMVRADKHAFWHKSVAQHRGGGRSLAFPKQLSSPTIKLPCLGGFLP